MDRKFNQPFSLTGAISPNWRAVKRTSVLVETALLRGSLHQPGAVGFVTLGRLARVGGPAEVIEQVMAYHEEFDAEFMWFMVDWPGMDPRFALESIQRFGEEVIPQIKLAMPPCPVP